VLNGRIDISNLVTCKSEIWQACHTGDLPAVWNLIDSRRASVLDVFDRCSCKLSHWTDYPRCGLRSGDTVLNVGRLLM